MKLVIILLTTTFLQAGARGYAQRVTINVKNASIEQVFDRIQQQTGYDFLYNNAHLKDVKPVSLNFHNAELLTVLEACFANQPLDYQIENTTILVRKKPLLNPDKNEKEKALDTQERGITGKVTNAKGESLEGVTITVKGTAVFSTTNARGDYSITVPEEGKTLIFTSVGYTAVEISIGVSNTINVVLKEFVSDLQGVVVVGYGTQRKTDLTGAVKRISFSEKSALGNVNLLQSISGVAAGVNVTAVGYAGGEPDFSIRGKTSLSANDAPLIVVDGIIFNGPLSSLNVNDIEAVDILKDASAAAVYGSRSANGVMLITTKKGVSEKPTVDFNMYYGFQGMTNNPMKVMNAEQYAIRLTDYYYQQELYNWYSTSPTGPAGKPVRPDITDREVVAMRLRTQEERDNYIGGNEIDWVKEVQRQAAIQHYSLNFSGKSARSSYFISGSHTGEQGILKNDQFSRVTFYANLTSEITNWLSLGMTSSFAYLDYSGFAASLSDARRASPLGDNHIGSPNYDMYVTDEFYMPYPLNNLYVDNSDTKKNLLLIGKAKVTIPWVKGLSYELNYSNNSINQNNFIFYPVTVPDGSNNKGQAVKSPSEETNWLVNNIATYLRSFRDHSVNATLLFTREHRSAQSSWLNSQGFDNPVLGYNNMALGTQVRVGSSAWEENSLAYMARVNYSYAGRYLLTATVRRDGFSGFSEKRKFANFPALSLGWVVSEEPFFDNYKSLYLKLRTSYGKNGNQGIGRYSSFSRMSTSPYVFGSNTAIGVFPGTLGNKDLGWETTTSFNIGLDFRLFNQRISGSVDLYQSKTTDVLVSRALPRATGYSSVWANIGAIDNKGIELELSTVNLEGHVSWKTDFVFSLNRDKISRLYGGESDRDIGNSWFVGEPIGAIYDYEMMGGLWTENDLFKGTIYEGWYPGQFKYVDRNADNVIDPNADRTIIGYYSPNYRFSINNTVSYKNFSLSFFINSIQGGKKYYMADNASVLNTSWRSDDVIRINASAVRPYWTPDNGVNNATGIYNSPPVSSGIYESRSFIRLQHISLSYKLETKLLNRFKLKSFQFFVASRNPYVWTKWSGWDPEIEDNNAPSMRNITVGANLSF